MGRRYAALDFDCRYLRAIYETGQPALRQRIARQVQRSGQSAHLAILDGLDYRSNAARLTDEDVKVLVDLLVANREWPRLWALVHLLAFPWSMRILQALAIAQWQPEDEPERAEFADLCRPGAVPARSQSGKNSTARCRQPCAAPWCGSAGGSMTFVLLLHRPQIAIGTGQRKLVLWDFQKASIEKVRQGFNHSISQVAFVDDDCLVCGVRSNSSAACMIYGWQGDDAFVLPGHLGAVTALCSAGSSLLLSAGRDGAVILWNVAYTQRAGALDPGRLDAHAPPYPPISNALPCWVLRSPCCACPIWLTAPRPPSAKPPIPPYKNRWRLSAAFVPGEENFLSGQRNGQVILYQARPDGQAITRKFLFNGRSPVVGLEFLPSRQLLISAMQSGRLELRHWPDLALAGSLTTGAEGLTSLHISPDGCFMAVGTSAIDRAALGSAPARPPQAFRSAPGQRPARTPGRGHQLAALLHPPIPFAPAPWNCWLACCAAASASISSSKSCLRSNPVNLTSSWIKE